MFVAFSFNNKGKEPNNAMRHALEREIKSVGCSLLKGKGAYRMRSGHYNEETSYITKVTRPVQFEAIVKQCKLMNQESVLLVKSMTDAHGNVQDVATLYYIESEQFVDIGLWCEVPRNHALSDENGFSEFNGKFYVVRGAA